MIGACVGLFSVCGAAAAERDPTGSDPSDASETAQLVQELVQGAEGESGGKEPVSPPDETTIGMAQPIETAPDQSNALPDSTPDSPQPGTPPANYEAIDDALDQPASPLDSVAFSIDQGEFAGTVEFLERYIRAIESAHHRLHPNLVEPLTLLGDAHFGHQRIDRALETYSRALHIQRVGSGLFAPEQVPVVYKQADALKALGNFEEASNREEYAYGVLRKAYGSLGEEVLPGTYRLADWFLESRNIFAARTLYEQAMRIHDANDKQNTAAALPALEGLVYTYREERFPPYYVGDGQSSSFRAAPMPLAARSAVFSDQFTINNFPAAERALQHIVLIRREDPQSTPMEVYDAILDLADWHLLWEHYRKAHTLYEYVYAQMEESEGVDAREYFAQPRLLHMPLPADPKPPRGVSTETAAERDRVPGFVETTFRVSVNGSAQNIEIVIADPKGLMDFRTRRSIRHSRYRPAMENGKAIPFENQTWRHEFEYVPREEAEEEDA